MINNNTTKNTNMNNKELYYDIKKPKLLTDYINKKLLNINKSPVTWEIKARTLRYNTNIDLDLIDDRYKLLIKYAIRTDNQKLTMQFDKLIKLFSSDKLEMLKLGLILFDNLIKTHLGVKVKINNKL